MGLFGSGKNKSESLEAKADALMSSDPLEANRLYRDALRKILNKDPSAEERLRGKVRDARHRLIEMKIQEAGRFLDDRVPDAAAESLAIAREHVKPDEQALAAQIETLAARVREAEGATISARGVKPPSRERDRFADEEDQDEYADAPEELLEIDDPLAAFEMYAGLLGSDYERAMKLGDRFKAGFVAYQQGDRQAALAAFQEEAAAHPDEALVHEVLGQVCDQLGDESQAALAYRRALASEPSRANSRVALAQIVAGLGRRGAAPSAGDAANAVELLREGEAVDPAAASQYRIAQAEILAASGGAADALALLDPLLEGDHGSDPGVWQLYATALEMQGSLDEAEAAYRHLTQLGGQSMGARAVFAEFALRHGRALDEAEKIIFETCLGCQATRPSEDQLDRYGVLLSRIQLARGEYKAALDGIERLLVKGAPPDLEPALIEMRQAARQKMSPADH
ncbi:MAG: hypothetical protein V1774_11105 [Candidatus Eisenbacteria bacterium]